MGAAQSAPEPARWQPARDGRGRQRARTPPAAAAAPAAAAGKGASQPAAATAALAVAAAATAMSTSSQGTFDGLDDELPPASPPAPQPGASRGSGSSTATAAPAAAAAATAAAATAAAAAAACEPPACPTHDEEWGQRQQQQKQQRQPYADNIGRRPSAGGHLRGPSSSGSGDGDEEGQGANGGRGGGDDGPPAAQALRHRAAYAALERALAERAASHGRLGARARAEAQRRSAAAAASEPLPAEAQAVWSAAVAAASGGPARAPGRGAAPPHAPPQRAYWAGPPVPGCEDARLRAVEAYALLADAALPDDDDDGDGGGGGGGDGESNGGGGGGGGHSVRPAVDGALRLVCSVFGVEEAVVALFGDRRIFIRDTTGAFARGDFPWRWSFCWWTLAPPRPTALVVPDVLLDARFSANSVAARAGVRFYCGVPLLSPDGHRLGVLAFASRRPRPDFDAASVAVASALAELVARELAREVASAVRARASPGARLRAEREAAAPVLAVERVVAPAGAGGGEEEGGGGGGAGWVVRHANGAWDDCWRRRWGLEDGGGNGADDNGGGGGGGVLGADLLRDLFEAPPDDHGTAVAAAVAAHAPFAITGVRLRRPGAAASPHRAPCPLTAAFAAAASFELRFVPAARPGALSATGGGGGAAAQLTAAPASLPDAPSDADASARLAALWFVDVVARPPGAAHAPGFALLEPGLLLPPSPPSTLASLSGAASASAATSAGAAAAAAAPAPAAAAAATAGKAASLFAAPARFSAEGQPGLPPSLRGLTLGGALASGAHGRVFRGRFHGARVAVKVLDAADVHRLDPATGANLECSLGEGLRHPFVVATLAWGMVRDSQSAVPARPRAWTRVCGGKAGGAPKGSAAAGVGVGGGGGGGGVALARPSAAIVRHGERLDGMGDEDEGEGDVDEAMGGGGASGAGAGSGPGPPACGWPPMSAAAAAGASADMGGQTWLVLEFCDRGALQDAIDAGWLRTGRDPRGGAPDLPAILAAAREIAAGLAYLHSEGVVHGDLSAYNVLLTSSAPTAALAGRGWAVKVADFGMARLNGAAAAAAAAAVAPRAPCLDGSGGGGKSGGGGGEGGESASASAHNSAAALGLSSGGHAAAAPAAAAAPPAAAAHLPLLLTGTYGTVTQSAPELLARGELSPAADVYGFGVLLWQMWTGARPWAGLLHAQVVRAVAVEGRSLVWPPGAPEGLAALGEACLAHDPRDRPSFADVLEVLAPLVELLEYAGEEGRGGGAGGGGGGGGGAAAAPTA